MAERWGDGDRGQRRGDGERGQRDGEMGRGSRKMGRYGERWQREGRDVVRVTEKD